MKFIPFSDCVEIEPIVSDNPILSDEKKFVEGGKVIALGEDIWQLKVGDIVFFRPHGAFETPEYEGKKHYVVKVHEEFILGKINND
jgi:hypothetical protein